MSLISRKSIIALCSISLLAAACAPRTNYRQQNNNMPSYASAPMQQQTIPLSGQPQTIQTNSLPQLAYNNAGVMAPVNNGMQPEPTYSMLTTSPIQAPYSTEATGSVTSPQMTVTQAKTFGYTIQKGDTLFAVGRKFNIHPQDIANHNSMINPHDLRVGQTVRIPSQGRHYPVDGIQGQNNVGSAGSVTSPDNTVKMASNTKANNNNSSLLDAVRASRGASSQKNVKYFKMPQQARIIQNYDGKNATGVRVVMPSNTPLRAASSGQVIYVGSVDGYGKMVLIRHQNGYVSNYAGLNKIHVKQGQQLSAGDMIATPASKGSSSMAEVLFELRQGTKTVNPHAFIG